jgi:hypothetical protein
VSNPWSGEAAYNATLSRVLARHTLDTAKTLFAAATARL